MTSITNAFAALAVDDPAEREKKKYKELKIGGDGRQPKREKDRQSASGKDKGNAKGGHGKGNWGSELESSGGGPNAQQQKPSPTAAGGDSQVPPEEPEEPSMTLEDYLKEQGVGGKTGAGVQSTAAERGMKGTFKGTVDDDDVGDLSFFTAGVKQGGKKSKKGGRKKKNVKKLDISLKIRSSGPSNNNNRRGRGRGGRGRRGGGRGRGGGGRGGGNAGQNPVSDYYNNQQAQPPQNNMGNQQNAVPNAANA